jgi:predicted amidophosphoribosyltransferase
MHTLKRIYFFCLEMLEPFLDSISSRLCFFCKRGIGDLVCKDCLLNELSLKKKSIDYKILDNFFLADEQIFHPKIFYLFNFFKNTSYLIKKAKYARPHFASFFARLLARVFRNKINTILNDELSESFLADLPSSSQKINFYVSYTPMYFKKEQERSFNFAKLLAEKFFHEIQINKLDNQEFVFQGSLGLKKHKLGDFVFLENLFSRDRNTRALFNLKQEDRISELKNSFSIRQDGLIINKNDLNILLIIDDICTTGSTSMELMLLSRQKAYFDDNIALSIYGRNLK